MTGITVQVLDYIEAHPSAKTRVIGAALNLTAKQVDNILYRYRQAIKPVIVCAVKKEKGNM